MDGGDGGVPTAARTTGSNRRLCPARPGAGVSASLGGCAAVAAAAVAPVAVPGARHKNRPYGSVAFPYVRRRTLHEQTRKRFKFFFKIVTKIQVINITISITSFCDTYTNARNQIGNLIILESSEYRRKPELLLSGADI